MKYAEIKKLFISGFQAHAILRMMEDPHVTTAHLNMRVETVKGTLHILR